MHEVVSCTPGDFFETYNQTVWVVAVVFAGQNLDTVKELSTTARRHCYEMGVGVPVYAATGKSYTHKALFSCGMDVVADVGDWRRVADLLYLKLAPQEPKVDVIWCDPLAASPTMQQVLSPLAKLGLNVELVDNPEALVKKANEDVAAIISSGRGIPSFAEIRENLLEDRARPLFWVVSLTATTESCYASGADAAIVCDNNSLRMHNEHLRQVDPEHPWMWNVVVGDLNAVLQATGVARTGGVQWSFPKLYDEPRWRGASMGLLVRRGARVFQMLAEKQHLKIADIGPNPDMEQHEARFQRARRTLKGYVRDRVLYHGTDLDAAKAIMKNGIRPSQSGMYGPGCYFVDPIGLLKASFFAMTKASRRDVSDRSGRVRRSVGAILAFRVAMCQTQIVTDLPQGWYERSTPCENGQESIIGVYEGGYNGCEDQELNQIAEYVNRCPELCVPIGMCVFERA